jgi:hypothetical protein
MLYEEDAVEILNHQRQSGGRLVIAKHADLPSVKRFQDVCLKADIPAVLGPCASGG